MQDRLPGVDVEQALAGIDERLIAAMNEHLMPGLAVVVVRGSEVVYGKGFGLAGAAPERPVTLDTVFRIGSISKTMTAIGLLQLCEDGRVDLDAPASNYLRAFPLRPASPTAPPITLRHLLTHTAGLGELREVCDLFRPVIGLGVRADRPVPPLAEYYAGGLRAEVPPDTKWAYSNHAFAVLGQVIEDVAGEPFPAYMRRRVFEPLGIWHTDYERSERVRDQLATGYAPARGKLQPVADLEIVVRGAGSVYSTPADMARYLAALLGQGANAHGRVLTPATFARLFAPAFQLHPRLPAMGLAFILDRLGEQPTAGHDGGWPGFVSSLLLAPVAGVGVVAFTNSSSVGPGQVTQDLLRRLLGVPEPVLPHPGVLEAPLRWPALCGAYGPRPGLNTNARFWLGFGGEIDIRPHDGRLALRGLWGPLWRGTPLYASDPADPLVYQLRHQGQVGTVVFGADADGAVDRLLMGFETLYKRPWTRGVRGRLLAGAALAGGGAVAAASLARWRGRRR